MGKILPEILLILLFLSLLIAPQQSTTAFALESRQRSNIQDAQSTRPTHTKNMMMTKSEIIKRVQWDENDLGNLSLFVPMLNKELRFVLFTESGKAPEVTDKMTATINDVLALQPENLDRVKELLWEECNFSFYVTDYGVEAKANETHLQANLREFGISNPDDAYKHSVIQEIHISDEFNGRYAEIKVSTASETYISIIIKNGHIIDFDDDGTHLGWFDKDEKHAHKNRQKVLAD